MNLRNIFIAAIIGFISFGFIGKPLVYKVSKQESKLTWVGKKVTGEHTGSIPISDGQVLFDGNKLTGGSFTIDMNSITNTDITDDGYKQKLLGHLKSDDFFATDKFPTSKLEITKVTPAGQNNYTVKGNLTIKGITKEVEFPATTTTTGKQLSAKAKIVVDRTKYDIKYGSGSFFDNLGDKAIDNDFELNVELVAKQ